MSTSNRSSKQADVTRNQPRRPETAPGIPFFATTAFAVAALIVANNGYAQSVTVGTGAHANSLNGGYISGVAIGIGANADSSAPATSGSSPVAIGINSDASGTGSQVAIGDLAVATGTNSIAIGGHPYSTGTSATGDYSVALGASSNASGYGSLAFGGDATSGATASAQYAIAFGAQATASQTNATAIGTGAQANGANASAIGTGAQANSASATAIGTGAVANNANDIALGTGSVTSAAVGTSSANLLGQTYDFAGATPTSTVSIGDAGAERTLTNLAAGRISATSTDAVNGSQLNATNLALAAEDTKVDSFGGSTAAALGGGAAYDASTGAISAPSYSVYGQTQNNVGGALAALQNDAPIQYSSAAAPTVGLGASGAVSNDVTLVGPNAGSPVTLHNVAAGVAATDAVNVSQLDTLGGSTASALGGGAAYDASTNTISAPSYTVYGQTQNNVGGAIAALQNNAPIQYSTAAAPTVGLGASGAVSNDVTLVGPNAGSPVALHNVAAGVAATDAVNVSQLDTLGGSTASALGGGAAYDPSTSTISAPSYSVYGQTQNSVGGAIAALQNNAPIQYSTAAAPTIGLGASGTPVSNDVTLVGPNTGSPVALHNVAAGVSATDAVNVSQLDYAMNTAANMWVTANPATYVKPTASGTDALSAGSGSVASGMQSTALGTGATASASNSVALGAGSVADEANTVSVGSTDDTRRVTNVAPGINGTDAVNVNQLNAGLGHLQTQIDDNLKKSYAGTAAAIAIAGLRYDDRAGKISAAAAAGYYHNQAGLAIGIGGTSQNELWRWNGGLTVTTTSSSEVGGVIGVSRTLN
ncbi:YadA-like family protein [Caballeronia sp. ATUFL_M2_KS44]|uniref:YadA family autotransporter adhesin n=1 Tax=Caballeronia sp. ATUFL_M2_KS44 TaxID=2921767 RepID=UPI002028F583|nr:YadA-like family protein [Caballeronia sp. ATUFL_M2_KS44]